MAQVGTVDIPERVERAHYFRELSYLELSLLFHGDVKDKVRDRWKETAPAGAIGLVAPWALTHAKPPRGGDGVGGEYRDAATTAPALAAFRASIDAVGAGCAVFHSPPLFAPSQSNRDRLKHFFGELATVERVGVERVWVPDGLWEPRSAVKFATELGVTCAIDPLVREPGSPPEIYEDLDAPAMYFRVEAPGRAATLGDELLEDLAVLVEHYGDRMTRIAFASRERWRDARNFKKLLAESPS